MRTAKKIRTIKPEMIRIGDIISVTEHLKDMTVTKSGTVGRRERAHAATEYYTPQGGLLLTVYRFDDIKHVIKLLFRDDSDNMLATMERIS